MLQPVVEILAWAISTYGRRNLRLACDAAQMLADVSCFLWPVVLLWLATRCFCCA